MRRLWLAMLLWLAVVAPASAENASWLDTVTARLGLAPTPAVATLDRVAAHIKAMPAETSLRVLAAEAGPDGHWRFVNRAGETFSAATPAEVTRAFAHLLPPASPQSPPLTIFASEASAFDNSAAFAALPRGTRLRLLVGTREYALFRSGTEPAQRLYAELAPRVLLALSTRIDFDEARAQLEHRSREKPVRLLALEPGTTEAISARPPPSAAPPARRVERTDPDRLRNALGLFTGQRVVLVGRIEGDRLVYQPSSGPERSLLVADLVTGATAADVDLVVLSSASARQPGTRNWLWLKADVAGLETGLERASLGELLAMLAGDGNRMLVSLTREGGDRVKLSARVVPIETGRGGTLTAPITGAVSDLIATVTGTATSSRVDLHLASETRRKELSLRLLPGIPALVQFSYLALLALALPGLAVAKRWWRRLWPLENRAEYGTSAAWWAARASRMMAFAVVFVPIAGWLATLAQVLDFVSSRRMQASGERSAAP